MLSQIYGGHLGATTDPSQSPSRKGIGTLETVRKRLRSSLTRIEIINREAGGASAPHLGIWAFDRLITFRPWPR